MGKELHRVEDVKVFGVAKDLLPIYLPLELGHHQEPITILTEAHSPVEPVEEEVNEDIDYIQLVGEGSDGVFSEPQVDEAMGVYGLLHQRIEVTVVSLVVKEDCTTVVLYDGVPIGEGRMSVAYLGVVVEFVPSLAEESIGTLVVCGGMKEGVKVSPARRSGDG